RRGVDGPVDLGPGLPRGRVIRPRAAARRAVPLVGRQRAPTARTGHGFGSAARGPHVIPHLELGYCTSPARQLIRFSRSPHSRLRSTNFCTLPVEVLGSSPNSTALGTLNPASLARQWATSSSPVSV